MVPLDRLEEDDHKAKRQVFHKNESHYGPLLCQHTGVIVRADCESQGEFRNVYQGIYTKGPRKRRGLR